MFFAMHDPNIISLGVDIFHYPRRTIRNVDVKYKEIKVQVEEAGASKIQSHVIKPYE